MPTATRQRIARCEHGAPARTDPPPRYPDQYILCGCCGQQVAAGRYSTEREEGACQLCSRRTHTRALDPGGRHEPGVVVPQLALANAIESVRREIARSEHAGHYVSGTREGDSLFLRRMRATLKLLEAALAGANGGGAR